MQYTAAQILSLSPNAGNASRGKALATTANWNHAGANQRSIWGECKGSGKNPYYTAIDLHGPVFKCSCPSREFPCKHGIGLFLLYVTHPPHFQSSQVPDWVEDWIVKREQKEVQKQEKDVTAKTPEELAKSEAAKEKREEKRLDNIHAGLQDVKRWIEDIIRFGLGNLPTDDARFWEEQAARLVDIQAPGLAGMFREIPAVFHKKNWPTLVLEKLAEIYLLASSFQNRDRFSDPITADVLYLIGISTKKEEILNQQGVQDEWQILGVTEEDSDRLKVRKAWFQGYQSQQYALVLDFAFGNQGFPEPYIAGMSFQGEIVYYPSNFPLRALVKSKGGAVPVTYDRHAHHLIQDFLRQYAFSLQKNPFLWSYPCLLTQMIPIMQQGYFGIMDANHESIPLSGQIDKQWKLLSISGGYPVTLFGEWYQHALKPLGVWVENHFYEL